MAEPEVKPERTFFFVKPEALQFYREILGRVDEIGRRVYESRIDNLPRQIIELHYEEHRNKPFFPFMVGLFEKQAIHTAVYEARDESGIILPLRRLLGHTNPLRADKGTIRGDYADKIGQVVFTFGEIRVIKSIAHASDSKSSAERELRLWADFLKVDFRA
ncbi:hypothetical protein FJZ17_00990 [Candidatus Pacearchaeota archaeon]|nr:hypothetical protein [Candidatus Pacearchaeota archaeon]